MKFPKIYKEKDADVNHIKNKTVGIIGFGNQGRAQALNLKDSGVKVCIGLRDGSPSKEGAEKAGFDCMSIGGAVLNSDIISMLVPDQVMGNVYEEYVGSSMKSGQILLFSHGYNIHYKIINPLVGVDCVLVAPSGAGVELRKQFLKGQGIPGIFAIENDYSGNAQAITLAYCQAIGLTKTGVVKSSFREETETDLFGEQVVLTGSIPKLIQSSYKVLLDSGYSPGVSWLVCYYELKTIVDMFHSKGFAYMNKAISDTAEYGGITRGNRIISTDVENEMKKILEEIRSESFHHEWIKEHNNNYPVLKKLRKAEKEKSIEEVTKFMLKELFDSE